MEMEESPKASSGGAGSGIPKPTAAVKPTNSVAPMIASTPQHETKMETTFTADKVNSKTSMFNTI